jgi:hypothetical protein
MEKERWIDINEQDKIERIFGQRTKRNGGRGES